MKNLQTIFDQIKKILQKYAKGPVYAREDIPNTTAKDKKPTYLLYGKKEAVIDKRKPRQNCVVGVILQKNFVGFYAMTHYSHPKESPILHDELKKMLKGKSCFHVTKLDASILKEIERQTKVGIEIYKKEGWV